jgi:hypothetical protein
MSMLALQATASRRGTAAHRVDDHRTRHAGPRDWEVARRGGWLTVSRWGHAGDETDVLTRHGDWAGPVKQIEAPRGGCTQRFDFYVGHDTAGQPHEAVDPEAAAALMQLQSDLVDLALQFDGAPVIDGWTPPAADTLAEWLTRTGREVAIDKEQNLRLTLKRRGCDGQVRVDRAAGRLRFVMPLGRWSDVSRDAERAMRDLACEANARARLVRIVWVADGAARRCDAQVDLSGLPVAHTDARHDQFWQGMTRMAVAGLELALRQLGLELGVLADPRHRDLVELVGEWASGRIGKSGDQ